MAAELGLGRRLRPRCVSVGGVERGAVREGARETRGGDASVASGSGRQIEDAEFMEELAKTVRSSSRIAEVLATFGAAVRL